MRHIPGLTTSESHRALLGLIGEHQHNAAQAHRKARLAIKRNQFGSASMWQIQQAWQHKLMQARLKDLG